MRLVVPYHVARLALRKEREDRNRDRQAANQQVRSICDERDRYLGELHAAAVSIGEAHAQARASTERARELEHLVRQLREQNQRLQIKADLARQDTLDEIIQAVVALEEHDQERSNTSYFENGAIPNGMISVSRGISHPGDPDDLV